MNSLNQIQHCISNSTRLQAACTSLNIAFILSDISILHLFLVFTLPLNPNRNLDLNRNSRACCLTGKCYPVSGHFEGVVASR